MRPVGFVLASTDHGTMIVNRFDYHTATDGQTYGVGHQLLSTGAFDSQEVQGQKAILELRRHYFADGVIAIDCGANIGVMTIEWARLMTGWGEVIAIEPQRRLFYALCGNIAINNCFNVNAVHAAVGAMSGSIGIPDLNYLAPASFGSLELQPAGRIAEDIGQPLNWETTQERAPLITLDTTPFARVDFIKMDVEGMEFHALAGAIETIRRCRPILSVEHIKSGAATIEEALTDEGYRMFPAGMNLVAVHQDDPCLKHFTVDSSP